MAIKQLLLSPSDADNDARRARFNREADTMKSLASTQKHLVRIIDLVERSGGLFIVMEYVDGPSLEQVLAQTQGALELRQGLGIIGGAAMALAAIHQRGVVHRDLKPSNLLLPSTGGLKVADFGLAALLSDQEMLSAGSVRYMAPELFATGTAEPRSDLYSLGMIAYELLAGRPAFNEAFRAILRDTRNQSLRWMKWHTNPRAQPPALERLNARVGPTVSELVARLMEKDPQRRIQSADELLGAIRRHYSGQAPGPTPVDGTTATTAMAVGGDVAPTAPVKRRRRAPLVLGVVLAVQVMAVAGIAGYFWSQQQSSNQQVLDIAQQRFSAARGDFTAKNYAEARAAFAALAHEWPDHGRFGKASEAHVHYCDAMIAWQEKRFTDALGLLKEADDMGVFGNRDRVQDDRERIEHDRGFASLLEDIQVLTDTGEQVEALALISRNRDAVLSEDETRRLDELATLVQTRHAQKGLTEIRQRVEALRVSGQHDDAVKLIDRLQQRRPVKLAALERLRQQVLDDKAFQALLAGALAAQDQPQPDLTTAIDLLHRAKQMKGRAGTDQEHEGITERLATLQSTRWFQTGQSAERQRELATARHAYEKAIAFKDHPQASAGLQRIERLEQAAQLIDDGKRAHEQDDHDAAIRHFKKALKLGASGPKVDGPLGEARLARQFKIARQFAADNRIDDARAEFKAVLHMRPGHEVAEREIRELDRRQTYLEHMAAGDKFVEQGRHSDAKLKFLSASQVLSTPQVAKRIEEAEFEDLIAKARKAIDQRKSRNARALLSTAAKTPAGQRHADRVKALFEELEKKSNE